MYLNDKMNKKMGKKWIYILMLGNTAHNNKCIYDYLMINVTSDKNSTHKLEDYTIIYSPLTTSGMSQVASPSEFLATHVYTPASSVSTDLISKQ